MGLTLVTEPGQINIGLIWYYINRNKKRGRSRKGRGHGKVSEDGNGRGDQETN
jgi:hypothetical protein